LPSASSLSPLLVRCCRQFIGIRSLTSAFAACASGSAAGGPSQGHRAASDAARSAFGQRLPDASLRWPDTRFVTAAVAHDHVLAGLPTRRNIFAVVTALGSSLSRCLPFRHPQHYSLSFACIASARSGLCFVVMIRALTTRSTGPAGTCLDLRVDVGAAGRLTWSR
jgi:hypothetical protein